MTVSPTGDVTDVRNLMRLLSTARLGLKVGDVIPLELDNVDWGAGELKVRGEGGQHAHGLYRSPGRIPL